MLSHTSVRQILSNESFHGQPVVIGAGRTFTDERLIFALRMGMVARAWRTSSEQLAKSAGYEGCSLIPLYYLAAAPLGLTQVELSRRMRLSEPSIVRMVRPLHDRDFISRSRMVGDGRARLIKITQEGLTALERFEPLAAEARKTLLQCVPDHEIELANKILLALLDKLPLISGADPKDSD